MLSSRLFRAVLVASLANGLLLLWAPRAAAQIVLQDRRLQGHVGLTNTTLLPPDIVLSGSTDPLHARSAGRVDTLEHTGPLFADGGPATRRAYEVVCEAWGGDYWLSVDATLNTVSRQIYRFGYALNRPGAPDHPTFADAFVPFRQRVAPSDPDPLPSVDLFECAGLIAVHFVEADPGRPGEYRRTTIPISAYIAAYPRTNPGDASPWTFADQSGSGFANSGAQARYVYADGSADALLWLRSSAQPAPRAGPDVGMQVEVLYSFPCTTPNAACPAATNTAFGKAWFAGRAGRLGSLDGYLEQSRASGPGLTVPCDSAEPMNLYVVVSPCMPPLPGAHRGHGGLRGSDRGARTRGLDPWHGDRYECRIQLGRWYGPPRSTQQHG